MDLGSNDWITKKKKGPDALLEFNACLQELMEIGGIDRCELCVVGFYRHALTLPKLSPCLGFSFLLAGRSLGNEARLLVHITCL